MEMLLVWAGRVGGVLGVLLCLVAAVARIGGSFWLGNLQVGTLLQGGIALMLAACLGFLAVLVGRSGTAAPSRPR